MTNLLRTVFSTRTGIVGAAMGVTAAGVAAGVAAERYLVRRARRGEDPYADEPFGRLPASEVRTVTTADGVDLHVEVVDPEPDADADGRDGDEPTVVFVHGFCLDLGTFHFQRQLLRGRYRMVFYDQPGHGRSGRIPEGPYSIERLGAALRTVLDTVVPQGRVILVGHSMGGMTIMALAERWPELIAERVAGVVFLSTSAGGASGGGGGTPLTFARVWRPFLPLNRYAGARTAALVDRSRSAATDVSWLLTRWYGFGRSLASPTMVSYAERRITATSIDVIVRYLETLFGHDRRHALAALRDVPVLVMCGDRDALTPLSHSEEIVKALPGARLEVIEDSGHAALMERAGTVNAHLDEFLRTACAGRSGRG